MAIPSIFSAYHDPGDCHVASLLAMTEVDGGWSCNFSAVEIGEFARPVGAVGRQGRRPRRKSRTHDVGAGALDGPHGNVTNLPEVSDRRRMLPMGRRGRRPLRFVFDTMNSPARLPGQGCRYWLVLSQIRTMPDHTGFTRLSTSTMSDSLSPGTAGLSTYF